MPCHRGAKPRGAFDPRVQMASGCLVAAACGFIVVELFSAVGTAPWARLDLEMLPLGLVLGAAVGVRIGRLRLCALRKVLPDVRGQFFLTHGRALSRIPEGARIARLRRVSTATAFLGWAAVVFFTRGHIFPLGTLAFYVGGQYLVGQTVPFVRLWLELRKDASAARTA